MENLLNSWPVCTRAQILPYS